MKDFLIFIITLNVFFACNEQRAEQLAPVEIRQNIFKDPVIREIYDLQDRRKSEQLIKFFKHPKSKYRRQAALSFASVQDTSALALLHDLLFDADNSVRQASAFAIGQIGQASSEEKVIDAYLKNDNKDVKAELLQVLGKCGTERGLKMLSKLELHDSLLIVGQLWGIARFSIRNIRSEEAEGYIDSVLSNNNFSAGQKYIASVYFNRINNSPYSSQKRLFELLQKNNDPLVRSNLARAIGQSWSNDSKNIAENILNSSQPLVIIKYLQALPKEAYRFLLSGFDKLLAHSDVNVAIAFSEFILKNASPQHAQRYLSMATADKNWRVAANLYHAAIKAAPYSTSITKAIKSRIEESNNVYEKAFMLRALGKNVANHKYVAKMTFGTENKVMATYGMEALVEMRASKKFDYYNDKYKAKGGMDLYEEFALLMKQAISSNQTPLIALAAQVLRNKEFNYINAFKNTYFLKQALHRLEMPKQIEAYQELQKTIDYFNGEETEAKQNSNNTIDWEQVLQIEQNHKVTVRTTKGDIELMMKINEAPSSVSSFVKLAKANFYNGLSVHRVVPNFVIQAGCPRGDGWGSPDFAIRSEFDFLTYKTGSVGMASAGKDTESSQWFITHSPTPHLDGCYTIFAEVNKGMDVVNKLEIGDRIVGIIVAE